MPKNTVTDLITDQEMAFAHLILSGTMTDRRAAEAVGLNPDTAAYTKAKPRVRAYMLEHRAAVREKLVDREAGALRKLNFGRDQILARLWELAHLSPEATRGSIAGQIKAMSMIAAIEGLIPDRRLSPSGAQPAAPPLKADIAEWLREEQHQTAGAGPADTVATGAQPASPHAPAPEPPPLRPMLQPFQPSVVKPFTIPLPLSRVPAATGYALDDFLYQAGFRPPISPEKVFSRR
ncbi:MAG: hypothetical protein WCD57_07265 [Acidobacteriaceae bacterium]